MRREEAKKNGCKYMPLTSTELSDKFTLQVLDVHTFRYHQACFEVHLTIIQGTVRHKWEVYHSSERILSLQ